MRLLGEKSRSEFLWWKEWIFFFFIKNFISSFYNFKWRENKSIYENEIFFENTDLILIKKKNLDLYFNEKYRSGFVKKNQICLLMKNTDLVSVKEKIQICILIKIQI